MGLFWVALFCLFSLPVVVRAFKISPLTLGVYVLCFFYALLYSYFPTIYGPSITAEIPVGGVATLSYNASIVAFLTFVWLSFLDSNINTNILRKLIAYFGVLGSIATFICLVFHPFEWAGVVYNPAMNGALLMLTLPFIFSELVDDKTGWFSIIIFVNTVALILWDAYLAKAGAPIITLWAISAVYLFLGKVPEMVKWITGFVFFGCFYFFSYVHGDCVLDRFLIWKDSISQLKGIDFILGKGPGSYPVLNVYHQLQTQFSLEGGLNVFAHSDIVQVVYEYGITGLILFVALFIEMFYKATLEVRAALVGFLALSCFYYPAHFPVHLGLLFIFSKLSLEPKCE